MLQTISNSFARANPSLVYGFLVAGLIMMMRNVCGDKVRVFFVCVCVLYAFCVAIICYLPRKKVNGPSIFPLQQSMKKKDMVELLSQQQEVLVVVVLSLSHSLTLLEESSPTEGNGMGDVDREKEKNIFSLLHCNLITTSKQRACLFL